MSVTTSPVRATSGSTSEAVRPTRPITVQHLPVMTVPGWCPRCRRYQLLTGRTRTGNTGMVRIRHCVCLACGLKKGRHAETIVGKSDGRGRIIIDTQKGTRHAA
jgi:ribosomal protein L32